MLYYELNNGRIHDTINPHLVYSSGYKLHVTNLPLGAISMYLRDIFQGFDGMLSINVVSDADTGKSQRSAFVEYKKHASRQESRRALHGTMLSVQHI